MGVRYWSSPEFHQSDMLKEESGERLVWVDPETGEFKARTMWETVQEYKKEFKDVHEVFPEWASPSQPSEEKELSDVNIIREALDGQRGEHQKLIAEYGVEVVATLIRKNSDYKGSAWQRPCLLPSLSAKQALFVRMSDKVARLQNLSGGKKAEVAESVADTVKDLAGYCILWLSIPEEVENDNAEAVESGT